MKTALVTGGAGFIGSHLTDALAEGGWGIIVLDDLSTGKKANIAQALRHPGVRFVTGTILDAAVLGRVCQGIDIVFHEAAIAGVARGLAEPLVSNNVNVTGTLNVLIAARENRVSKVVFASSAAVYGETQNLPGKEDMVPHPKSLYAVTKLTAEYYCNLFTESYGVPTVCLRYFNVFGPRQDSDSEYSAVIPRFINNALHNRPLTIFGDGENTRDYVFVKDVARANILAAESRDARGIFNIGSGVPVNLNRLATLVSQATARKACTVYDGERPGEVKHSLADISKASIFGYAPEYSFEAGLTATVQSFQSLADS